MAAKNRSMYGGYTKLQSEASGFFRLEKINGKWWFIDPGGCAFIIIGMNHFTSSSLRYPDNIHIWRDRYGASEERWVKEGVAAPLKELGFNTLAWTQELASGKWGAPDATFHHTPEWPAEHYKWAKMPYVYTLEFAQIERWNPLAYYPNVFSSDFADWSDYLAREHCALMADDPYLIGYAFCAMPGFTKSDFDHVKTWASDLDLETDAGRKELTRIVVQYFKVITDAIRRYDSNHLILGDRFNGMNQLTDYLLEAIAPFIDVFSMNLNGVFDEVNPTTEKVASLTGLPVYMSDSAFLAPTELLKVQPGNSTYCEDQAERGRKYQEFARKNFKSPHVVGWSWCAYLENRIRCSGIRNCMDEPYEDCTNLMREFNEQVYETILGE
ncbi:hypothetical protein ACFL1X_00950 [Candidatus Hydrogenedentota bacterium]